MMLETSLRQTSIDAASSRRKRASEQRRQAILQAALEVFAAEGFAAARLDDVAARAGVAKGTIYLFFADKEALFEHLLIGAVTPVLARVEALSQTETMSIDEVLEAFFVLFRTEVLGTKRREIIRLVITEGRRFPKIAETYHREIISKGQALITGIARKAREKGELASDDLINFPHLIFAPLLMSLIWEGLFSELEPLDVENLFAAHRRLLMSGAKKLRRKEG